MSYALRILLWLKGFGIDAANGILLPIALSVIFVAIVAFVIWWDHVVTADINKE